ncbi:TPA: hypothetical protein ENX78_13470 [Candidatus Poribacteria bacterium]|nr:hypothetical protein [Candidatus Poribacteria bacterium]
MQYGNLTPTQREKFDLKQKSVIRKPSFLLWIEGFGDTTEYVLSIDTEIGLESLRGRGNINIGRAILELNNEKGYFYSEGRSKIKNYARMKVWAGFDGLNVPIFTGIVYSVKPISTLNTVIINCRDYMGLFYDYIVNEIGLNNTPKSILEYLCSKVGVLSEIESNEETTMVYDELKFISQRAVSIIEKICDSIFYIAYFNEDGILNFVEREYFRSSNWKFDDTNVIDCIVLADSEVINDITVEYKSGFFSRYYDQASIDEYKLRSRQVYTFPLGSDLVSEQTEGTRQETLNYNLEGFKFTSAENSSLIDTIQIRLKKVEANGYLFAKIYTDVNGVPGELIGTSNQKPVSNLNNDWAWESFCFDKPIRISPMTSYWCIIDTSLITNGIIYIQTSNTITTGKYVYYNSSSWQLENNKQVVHIIRGNKYAQRVASDLIRFYKTPHERINVIAPAIPNLQLTDSVMVDVKKTGVIGTYIIERRRHTLNYEKYTTIDTLRKVG